MNRSIIFLLFALVALPSMVGCATTRVSASSVTDEALQRPIDFERPNYDALAEAIVIVTNAVREKHGVPALPSNRVLEKAARGHARKMVKDGFLAHLDPNTPELHTPDDRIRRAGGKNPKAAENIADVPAFQLESGEPFYLIDPDGPIISLEPDGEPVPVHTYASYAAAVVEGWMNSPGHRRNLLAADALEIGVGAMMYRQQHIPTFVVVQKFQLFEPLQ